jgi:hypothetical protein
MVNLQTVENLLRRSAGPRGVGRPAVQRLAVAVRTPRPLQTQEVRRRASGEDGSAGLEGLHHGGRELVSFLETRMSCGQLTTERLGCKLQGPFELSQELDERAVAAGRSGGALGRGRIRLTDRRDRRPCCLAALGEVDALRPCPLGPDQIGEGARGGGCFVSQREPLKTGPEEDAR